MKTITFKYSKTIFYSFALTGIAFLSACSATIDNHHAMQPAQSLPVVGVRNMPITIYQEYTASIEGTRNIEIRSQVEGYLDKAFVDEGATVKKGDLLFKINDGPYQEQLNNAKANLLASNANLEKSELEVNRLTPLVQNNIVSDVQLKTAQSAYQAAKANVSLAQAMVNNAQINLGYTRIVAPADGFIGKIPYKIGSLVGKNETQALTVLSDVNNLHVYFSMSEADFMKFMNQFEGRTVDDKIKHFPPVELVTADNTVYAQKGKVETVIGQFDRTMGTISFRAIFPNANGLLRSGNTGRVRIPQQLTAAVVIPEESTFELQDKVFVYAVSDSNKVIGRPITIVGKSHTYYLVNEGIKSGDKIVYAGLGRLRDGVVIDPKSISMDSLLRVTPL
jgi:membrane fusion protein, multidrug efflux system